MAAFDPGTDPRRDLALRLLTNTPVTLYHRPDLLEQAVGWLDGHGYQIVRIDATARAAGADLNAALATALGFPDHYGHTLDGLNDGFRDVVDLRCGWRPDATGLVLVFAGYHDFRDRHPRAAQIVLDIIAAHSRYALLFGRRLLCLVHSDDPGIRFAPVGATPVLWNDAERRESTRNPR